MPGHNISQDEKSLNCRYLDNKTKNDLDLAKKAQGSGLHL
jgi:hypothetical protein